ncbi:regulator protein [Amycolatopsis albispora]|uniref:Regulator protein n=2 Tax=Amycolatopsis albispora TaxID=1804986 RepID=A0A344LLF3_9PSEU|nr:regulator protein [Amycolatopsis albispora]
MTTAPAPRRSPEVEPAVPRELEHPPAHFTNRTEQLELLDRLLDGPRDRPVVQVISGLGGIGKSALARHWVHRVRARFPRGQLYADLGAFNAGGPTDTGELLKRFLEAFGIDGKKQPAGLDELKALYRSETAGRPLLVVLDDAVSSEQVAPLIPTASGSVVVVTSRFRLGGLRASHGARRLELTKFEHGHGVQLLSAIVDDERTEVLSPHLTQMVSFCDGLPIALHVLGVKLANQPHLSAARAAAQLERLRLAALADQKENLSVTSTFDLSYQDLSPEAARLYRALGLHPGPEFGLGAASGAAGRSVDDTEVLLGELVQSGLLDANQDRFEFHDLVRMHAGDKAAADPVEAEAARRRILEWYLHAARRTEDTLTVPDQDRIPYEFAGHAPDADSLPGNDDALPWLERERPNLIAAIKDAVRHELPELAWQLAAAMWPLFLLRKHYRDFLTVSQLGVECAEEWGNTSAKALMLNRSGAACRGAGRFDEAIEYYTAAKETLAGGGDQAIAIRSMEGLGLVALAQGRTEDALAHFEENLAYARRLERAHDVNLALVNLGVTLVKAGRAHEAVDRLEQAKSLLDAQGDEYNRARAQIDLGRALAHDERFDEARAQVGAALATMESAGSAFEQARAIHALGDVAKLAGDIAEARARYEAALPIYTELNRPEAKPLAEELRSLA